MIKTLHQVQTQTDRKNQIAQNSVNYAALRLDAAQYNYDQQERYIDSLLGVRDSAFFVKRLGNLAAIRIELDNSMVTLEIAIADLESVKTHCAIDLDAAYAWRDQAALQAALDNQVGWLTE